MAGSFGYEADHYQVGLQCGERSLLPAVRKAGQDDLIITDGFSCREMILQETDRKALHFAQVLQMALREGPSGSEGERPEARYVRKEHASRLPLGLIVAIAAATAGILLTRSSGKNVRD